MRLWCIGILLLLQVWVFADPGPTSGLKFIQNKGQWPLPYKFSAGLSQGQVLFANDRIVFSLREKLEPNYEKVVSFGPHRTHKMNEDGPVAQVNGHVYQILFKGMNADAAVFGYHDAVTRFNYFLDRDSSQWVSGAASYYGLVYKNVYDGVDMRYTSSGSQLKYEWIVSPQSDPSRIQIHYDGVDEIGFDNDDLVVKTSVGDVTELTPYAYQIRNGQKVTIPCLYRLTGTTVSYLFPDGYDECLELVIDPIIIFSAYSGSTADNWGNTATYDSKGNVYSGGIVERPVLFPPANRTRYPVTTGAYQTTYRGGLWDVGILKYDSAGQRLLYCTFLGGNDSETPQSMVTDANGDLLILGVTGSSTFPVTNGSTFKGGIPIDPLAGVPYRNGSDLFVAKLSADGSQLKASTFLGGTANEGINMISGIYNSQANSNPRVATELTRNYGDELRGDIICDAAGFVYIASNTRSSNFPAGNTFGGGTHDGVVVKLNPDLSSIVWSRFIGGAGTDVAYSIRFDKLNTIFVAGGTTSSSIAGMNGLHKTNSGDADGWIVSMTNDGNTINGTFLGTPQYDQSYFIDLNTDGDVFAYGQSLGEYAPGQTDVMFIHHLTNDLTSTKWIRMVGPGIISPTAFLVSDCGYIYVSGWGGLINSREDWYVGGQIATLPVTPDAHKDVSSGDDFYLLVLSEDGQQNLYGTFFGGTVSRTHVDGGTSRFDKAGIVYHAVCAGCGGASDFPAINVSGIHQSNGSDNCNNAVFKFDLSLLRANLQTNSVELDHPGLNKICLPDPIVFQNLSNGGVTYEWDLGDGTTFIRDDKSSVTHQYENTGRYKVWLKAIDKGTCMVKDSTYAFVDVYTADVEVSDDALICAETPYQLQASGGATYLWEERDGTFTSEESSPYVTLTKRTTFDVTVTTAEGCVKEESVTLDVTPVIHPEFEYSRRDNCFDIPSVHVRNTTSSLEATDQLQFDFGDGTVSDLEEVHHRYEKPGIYTVKLVGIRNSCVTEKSVQASILPLKIPNVITPDATENKNDVFTIQLGETIGVSPQTYDLKTDLVIYNRWGKEVFKQKDYQYNWRADAVDGGVYYYEITVDSYETCKGWLHVIK